MLKRIVPVALAAFLMAVPVLAIPVSVAVAEHEMPTVGIRHEPNHGQILSDRAGMTLYRWDRDEMGTSNCYDQCATNWPPLIVAYDLTTEGPLGYTTRRDGSKQVTWNGYPLYYYARDTQPGETTGQGVGGTWWVVKSSDTMMMSMPGM